MVAYVPESNRGMRKCLRPLGIWNHKRLPAAGHSLQNLWLQNAQILESQCAFTLIGGHCIFLGLFDLNVLAMLNEQANSNFTAINFPTQRALREKASVCGTTSQEFLGDLERHFFFSHTCSSLEPVYTPNAYADL